MMGAFETENALVDQEGLVADTPPVAEWRGLLSRMQGGWQDAVRRAEARRSNREGARVERWQVRLRQLQTLQARLRDGGLWYHGRPDMLGILRRARRESYHSLMLAWLLDPGTPHGFGTEFLRGFLDLVGVDMEEVSEEELPTVDVSCEVVGPSARTDLVISAESFTVAVEVKVDAGEGENQLERIFGDFAGYPNPHFVFLTPGGGAPRRHGRFPADEFRCLSFRDVRDTLTQVLSARLGEFTSAVQQGSIEELDPRLIGWSTALTYLQTLRTEFR